jgi:hypothetical protein
MTMMTSKIVAVRKVLRDLPGPDPSLSPSLSPSPPPARTNVVLSTAVLIYDKSRKATWRHVYFEPVFGGENTDPQPALFVGVQLV